MNGVLLWALVLVPAVAGAVLCLGALAGSVLERLAASVAVAVAAVETGLALLAAVRRPAVSVPFAAGGDLGLAVDALSAAVLLTVAAVALAVLVFAVADIREARARFDGLMLLFVASVALTATATNLPTLLFAWEVMGACSYALVGFRWREQERVGAGAVAFLTTRAGDLGLYLAAGAALAGGHWALTDLGELAGGWRHVAAAGLLVAALGKAAQLPFSFWLSRAMQGPSPVSALLHSAAMVAMGGYLLLRTEPLLRAAGWAAPTAAWIGATTAVLLGVVGLAQRDLKQLLAASTSAQLGFVVLAAGAGTVAGGAEQLVAHAATKAALFLAAGAWLSALGTKQLPALRGAARRWPVVGAAATLAALALAGLPPLSLWATKDAVLAAAREQSLPLYLTGLLGGALSAGYAARIIAVIWFRRQDRYGASERFDTEEQGTRQVGVPEQLPIALLAGAAAVLGVLALPDVTGALQPGAPAPGAGELAMSGVLAVIVVVAVVVLDRRSLPVPVPAWLHRAAGGWLLLEPAAQVLVVRPVLRLADTLARADDRLIARSVTASARGTVAFAQRASRFDMDDVDGAVRRLARLVRRAGDLARRPQTGQLYQYYLQAVAVLAAGALLLAVTR